MTMRSRQGRRTQIVILLVAGYGMLGPPPIVNRADSDPPPRHPPSPHASPADRSEQSRHSPALLRSHPDSPPAATPESQPAPPPLPAADPVGQQDPVSSDKSEDADSDSLRNSLNQVLLRDRHHPLFIERGITDLSAGRISAALAHLQAVLDAPQDTFFWDDEQQCPVPACEAVSRLLSNAAPETRHTYERVYGPPARQLLLDSASSEQATCDLLRRYLHTEAGRIAAIRQARIAQDTGRRSQAVALWSQLLADQFHAAQLSARDMGIARQMLQNPVHVARRSDAESRVSAEVTSPYPIPVWYRQHQEDRRAGDEDSLNDWIAGSLQQWSDERTERALPRCVSCRPLIVGDVLIYRDFSHIRALHVDSGAVIWSYRPEMSLVTAWQQAEQHGGGTGASAMSFTDAFAGNSLLGHLSTDGQRVYVIDALPRDDQRVTGETPSIPVDALGRKATSNSLLALPLWCTGTDRESEKRPVWVQGASVPADGSRLQGHYFLGAPTPANGRLYVLTESSGQLNLVALTAATGDVLWVQGIGLAEYLVGDDARRSRMTTSPVVAGNIVACSTEAGTLIGVDAITGKLLWHYLDVDEDRRQAVGRWAATSIRSYGLSELPSQPVVTHGHIFYLPDRSRYLHAVELQTGVGWKFPRDQMRFIAGVWGDVLMLVGDHVCSGISLCTRSIIWQKRIPLPAGHGVLTGDQYLLPTGNGDVIALRFADGETSRTPLSRLVQATAPSLDGSLPIPSATYAAPASNNWIGELLPHRDLLISVTPTTLAIFRQSGPLLEQLNRESAKRTLSDTERLALSILHIQAGQLTASRDDLQALVQQPMSGDVQARAIALLREILHTEVRSSHQPEPSFALLESLAVTPSDRARVLLDRLEYDPRPNQPSLVMDIVQQFVALETDPYVPLADDGESLVLASSRCCELLGRWRSRTSNEQVQQFAGALSAREAQLDTTEGLHRAHQFLRLLDTWDETATLRGHLASRLTEQGHLQEAELLLLRNSHHKDPTITARALRSLAELYDRQGLVSESAAMLIRLGSLDDDTEFGSIQSNRDLLAGLDNRSETLRALKYQLAEPVRIDSVIISEHRCDEECDTARSCESRQLAEQHDRVRRRIVLAEHPFLKVLDVGTPANYRAESLLRLIDNASGRWLGEIPLPIAYPQIPPTAGHAGHLLSLGGGTAHGISLLERRQLWQRPECDDFGTRDKVRIGPRGLTYCVLQTGNHLAVVHPATGKLLWERTLLAHDAGMQHNEVTGVIGDEQVLIVFEADQLTYSMYHMRSGRSLGTGALPTSGSSESLRVRQAAGRCLCYISDSEGQSRLRIWDPAAKSLLLDELLLARMTSQWTATGELAYISAYGVLRVIDPHSASSLIEVVLRPHHLEGLTSFSLTGDRDRLYLDLVHDGRRVGDDPSLTSADDLEVPSHRLRGLLLSILRSTGDIEWEHRLGEASLVMVNDARIPVLVLVQRRRDGHPQHPGTLLIEVRDAATGEVLGRRENLLRNRIVHCHYDPLRGQMSLVGAQLRIDVRFGATRDRFLIHAAAELDDDIPPLIR